MSKEPRRAKLTKRVVDSAPPGVLRYDLWDSTLPGFGLRVAPSGKKSFIVRYRPKGPAAPKRFITLGRYGPTTTEEARDRARAILGAVARGEDPARQPVRSPSMSVSTAARQFLDEHVSKRKPHTVEFYQHVLMKRVEPALGHLPIAEVTRTEVAQLHNSLSQTPYLANRALAVLGSLFSWAEKRKMVPENQNPTRGVEKFRESRRERYLTSSEMKSLGDALREAETVGLPWDVAENGLSKHMPKAENRRTLLSLHTVGAIRLLILTGCRVGEILNLRWEEVDFERGVLTLPDSKTGRKVVLLGAPALRVLSTMPRVGVYVVPGADPTRPRTDLKKPWAAVQRQAGLMGVRLHDLRHSFASVGAGAGYGLPILGRLLGHTQASTTARYAHLADDPLRRAAEGIALQISTAMGEGGGGEPSMPE
jgi:integrase